MRAKRTLLLAVAAFLPAACTHREAFSDAKREIESQDLVIEQLQRRNDDLLSRERALQTEVQTLRTEVEALRRGREVLSRGMEDVDARIRTAESQLQGLAEHFQSLGGTVTVKPHAEGVALEVAETLLFPPGSAELRTSGVDLVREVGRRLAALAEGTRVRVEGHTDDQPVVRTIRQFPRGNLELSGERALTVAMALIKEAGLDSSRVSFAGYGEHRPIVANDSDANRARNRRVEIVVLSPKTDR